MFNAGRINVPRRVTTVRFEISTLDGELLRSTEREVILFRPLLKSVSTPLGTTVDPLEGGRGKLTDRLVVSNVGDGTAMIRVEVSSSGRSLLATPRGAEAFVKKYNAEVISEFQNTKTEFPRYGKLLGRFIELTRNPPDFSPASQKTLRSTVAMAQRAFERDRSFLEKILNILVGTYVKNLKLVTEMNSLLDYINSIGTGRVIVSNALDVIRLGPGATELSLELRIADAALKSYPPIQLSPIVVVSEHEVEVPIHCLFDWQIVKSELEQRLGA